MQINQNVFFKEIEMSLPVARNGFLATAINEDNGVRSVEDAKLVLAAVKSIYSNLTTFLKDYPSMDTLFEKNFTHISSLTSREIILEICFLDSYLFEDTKSLPLFSEAGQLDDLLKNYELDFADWCKEVALKHDETQKIIKENFDDELKPNQLSCQCIACIADYRGKLRETIYKELVELINQHEEELHELILEKRISFVSDYVARLKQLIDRRLQKVKYRLKRGSLNKLEADVKAHYKSKFGYNTELGKVHKEKLLAFFNGVLVEKDIKPELISSEEYERFFNQLNIGIWKAPNALTKEFEKLVRAIMAYKRKDISATILRDYLGQFWVHSSARRKNRKVIYHMGPTNSGKTYNAIEALALAKSGCYLAPLRLLASELYDTLSNKKVKTTLLTGEEVIEVEGATHYSSTIEMAKLHEDFECAVIDEIQMITDPQRGWAWTRALINMDADEVHLCGDPSVLELVEKILKLTGDTLEVRHYERMTKLNVMNRTLKLVDLDRHDALIVFSRRNALKYKSDLENLGFKVSIVYGRLSPEVRREQARKFDEGETDVIVATDAISMGMNLPIKRIVFSTLSKFINSKELVISNSEIKQIAGRAGRFKRFPEGSVSCLQKVENGLELIEEAISYQLDQKELSMVGPDLEIYQSVNDALKENNLSTLSLSEFLRLFNTMTFEKPFFCVDLSEMIEIAEMVELADSTEILSEMEVFGFTCAPVNLGLVEHVQYFVWILNHYVGNNPIINEPINVESDDIDYLETAIKCVELYQWLARHFSNKNFTFDPDLLLENKMQAIEKLNELLSEKISKKCSSCGAKLPDKFSFNICEGCFGQKRFTRKRHWDNKGSDKPNDNKRPPRGGSGSGSKKSTKKKTSSFNGLGAKKKKKSIAQKLKG